MGAKIDKNAAWQGWPSKPKSEPEPDSDPEWIAQMERKYKILLVNLRCDVKQAESSLPEFNWLIRKITHILCGANERAQVIDDNAA